MCLNENGYQYRIHIRIDIDVDRRIRVTTMYVCICKGITESDVEALGRRGITCPNTLAAELGIDDKDTSCGRCLNHIVDLITIASRQRPRHPMTVRV